MSQQIVAEASENWKQLLWGHHGLGFGAEIEPLVGRFRVPMMMAGWLRGVSTLGSGSGFGFGFEFEFDWVEPGGVGGGHEGLDPWFAAEG